MNLGEIEKDNNTYERFLRKVDVKESGCWDYKDSLDKDGYGRFWLTNKTVRAHRYSYETHKNQSIPKGLIIDHLCRNRGCVNPDHLELVSYKVNYNRGIGRAMMLARPYEQQKQYAIHAANISSAARKAKTHCRQGHEYTYENTGQQESGRLCKTCKKLYSIKYKLRGQ